VRERALDGLQAIGPDAVLGELLKANTLAVNDCKATWMFRRVAVLLTIGLAGILVYSCLSTCNYNNAWSWYSFLFGGLCAFVSGIFFLVVKPSSGSEFRRRSLLGLLCVSVDPRTVGALCDCLRSTAVRKRDVDLNESVRDALVRLLPRVKGTIAVELTSQQKQGKALLRSSESPTAAAELLREAQSPEADPDELLRPGSDVDESQ
jgi:hypothetical protein